MDNQSIEEICAKAQNDKKYLFRLLDIGRKTGFQNFINRKFVWPFLMQLDSKKVRQSITFQWKGDLDRSSTDFDQLQKDAERSLSSMKTFENITKFHLKKRQQAVLSVLDSFFAKNTDLKYIQGFHDVASIFLIIFGNSSGYYLMEKAGRTYFHDSLKYEFGSLGMAISQIVYQIIIQTDPDFQTIFHSYQQSKFLIFILPWVLTWFAHNFNSVKMICRIWDYILCTGPHGVLFLTCGIILGTKQDLIKQCCEFDEPTIQTFYQQQAKHESIDIEKCISIGMELEEKFRIQNLKGYKNLQKGSMFRMNNFSKRINIHQEYINKKIQMKRKKQNLFSILKLGSFIIAIVLILLALNHTKNTFQEL